MARMTRLATWTGWSRARKRRAVHPSITRLARASSRSSIPSLQDLRPDEDDHRRHVDPGQEPGGERERTVGLEDTERAREEAERDLGDLPEHGRYQRRAAGRAPLDASAGCQPEHEVEEPEAHGEPDGRRHELEQQAETPHPAGGESLRGGLDAEAHRERSDSQNDHETDEGQGVQAVPHERSLALASEDVRHRRIDRTEDRRHGEQCADQAEAEREGSPFDELADQPGLLTGGGRQQSANDGHELRLCALGAIDEAEDADDQGQERDEREEDLVGDRAGEERPVVGEERADHVACRYEDAALPFGAGAGMSDFGVSPFAGESLEDAASLFPSAGLPWAALPSPALASPVLPSAGFASPPSFCAGRISVLYQPPPLNTIAGVAMSLRGR